MNFKVLRAIFYTLCYSLSACFLNIYFNQEYIFNYPLLEDRLRAFGLFFILYIVLAGFEILLFSITIKILKKETKMQDIVLKIVSPYMIYAIIGTVIITFATYFTFSNTVGNVLRIVILVPFSFYLDNIVKNYNFTKRKRWIAFIINLLIIIF